jgi:hypothetical protein
MFRRTDREFRPAVERIEVKYLLSAGLGAAHAASFAVQRGTPALPAAETRHDEFTLSRITNTKYPYTVDLKPPFQQVLVQAAQPVPGQVYNILELSVRNETRQTFTASNGFSVRLATSGSAIPRSFPILTGNEQWKPQQFITFYVLTKRYYPVNPTVSGGFTFSFDPGRVAIPGPSGIALRIKYDPARFARTLDWVVAYGPGAEGGQGAKLGLPDTAIWQFVVAKQKLRHASDRDAGPPGSRQLRLGAPERASLTRRVGVGLPSRPGADERGVSLIPSRLIAAAVGQVSAPKALSASETSPTGPVPAPWLLAGLCGCAP